MSSVALARTLLAAPEAPTVPGAGEAASPRGWTLGVPREETQAPGPPHVGDARSRLVVLAIAAAAALLRIVPELVPLVAAGGPFSLPQLAPVFGAAALWGLLTPAVLALSRRFPLDRGFRVLSVGVHVMAAVAGVALAAAAARLATTLAWPDATAADAAVLPGGDLAVDLLVYLVLAAVGHAVEYRRRYRDRGLETSRLETRLAVARLQLLERQLQPHFLFNTLNSIAALVHEKPDAAERMTVLLADLLRQSLETSHRHVVPLEEELGLLERYLEIETTRFPDRLRLHVELDPRTLDAMVPALLLQPLVENAVKHGVARRSAAVRIELRASIRSGRLLLEVEDDGPGLPAGGPARRSVGGVGLSNTRERLVQLYGDEHRFEVGNSALGGVLAQIEIPFAEAGSAGQVNDNDGNDGRLLHARAGGR